jgi:GAG-pre-integrase domain
MIDYYPLWTVDSGVTDHVAKDRDLFVDFRRIPQGSKWLYVGNNSCVPVKGIGTCKVDMCDGRTLLLHDVFFALKIRWNLIFVVVLLRFGFTLNMCGTSIKLYLDDVCYGYGYVSNDFIILDVVNIMISYNTHFSLISHTNDNIDVNVWHMRLDHIGQQMMDRLAKEGLLGHLERVSLPTCENYLKEKNDKKTIRNRNQIWIFIVIN